MALDFKKLILAMGFKEDQLPKVEEGKDLTDAEIQTAADALNNAIKESYKNDKGFMDEVNTAAFGRAFGEVQRKVKQGLELEIELKPETKIEDLVNAAKAKMVAGSSKTVQQMQSDFATKEAEYQRQLLDKDKVINEKEGLFKRKEMERSFDERVRSVMKAQDTDKTKLTSPAEHLFPFIKQTLVEKYDLTEQDGRLTLLAKGGGGQRPKDGHNVLTDEQVIANILKEEKLVVETKAKPTSPNGSAVKVVVEGEAATATYQSEGLQKAQAKMEGK